MVAFEARWRTSASIKLQNSTDTASSLSAIQYPPDLLFFLSGALEKDEEKKASYTYTVAFFSVFGLLWTTGENEKNTMRYRMKTH